MRYRKTVHGGNVHVLKRPWQHADASLWPRQQNAHRSSSVAARALQRHSNGRRYPPTAFQGPAYCHHPPMCRSICPTCHTWRDCTPLTDRAAVVLLQTFSRHEAMVSWHAPRDMLSGDTCHVRVACPRAISTWHVAPISSAADVLCGRREQRHAERCRDRHTKVRIERQRPALSIRAVTANLILCSSSAMASIVASNEILLAKLQAAFNGKEGTHTASTVPGGTWGYPEVLGGTYGHSRAGTQAYEATGPARTRTRTVPRTHARAQRVDVLHVSNRRVR
jgi:hypothetical protein